jgi:uncharacterized membrane-anchored protein YitT (DUF2179 family)
MNTFLHKLFKWNLTDLIKNTIGVILFAITINLFIEPNNLYSGGVFGLAQLLDHLLEHLFNISRNLTGIIYLILNIPLFILAFKKINKSFCARTIYTILVQTVLLVLIPIPSKPIVPELLTNVLIGGTLVGVGCALILSSTGSTGGTDIIGIVLTNKYPRFSVGKFALIFNSVIYGISGVIYGLSTMVYSILYSIIENISIDKLHDQNVCSCAILFTKNKPEEILDFVNKDLNRGATWWKGIGDGTKTTTYITYLILSRYELHKLEKFIKITKQDVFMVKNDYIEIDGNFSKRL